jgi:hypothetical protein
MKTQTSGVVDERSISMLPTQCYFCCVYLAGKVTNLSYLLVDKYVPYMYKCLASMQQYSQNT